MARSKNGGAPRTLFSLDRSSGKRGRRAAAAADTNEIVGDRSEQMDPMATMTAPDDASSLTMPAHAEPCPSCDAPLVAGALFCGECGTKVAVESAAMTEPTDEAEVVETEPTVEAEVVRPSRLRRLRSRTRPSV